MIRPRANLSDEVASVLRDRILSGVYKPEEKLPQDEIARDLEVSKLPVREALIQLQAEGLVTNLPRRGSFVASITREDVLDAYALYGLISGYAARRAAEVVSEEEVDKLERFADEMESMEDAELQASVNFEFHAMINRAGGSRRLRSTLRTVSNTLPTNFFGVRWVWSGHAHADHRRIIGALRSRDGDLAFETMYEHLRRSGEHAVTMLDEAGFWRPNDDGAQP
jgi:DNA-binding GntR family transcriptional regulator